ncbi:PleD family two-component system response regulator [Kiloniella sp. b19]|uniref:PleD family two-component system response regulator n=1 Tax=Kiloniella sp. GXU_MW_B19 TaxID=3141326 RepID=UPI0031E0D4C0
MAARVLVVDDIPANVRLLEAKLMAEYFEVISATDGPSALEVVESEMPDIILLDIMMPGMDGYEVCTKLKANPKTRHIPVVMVTALSDPNDRVRGLEAGADDFLTKPLNDVALFSRVRSLVRLKMMTDELRVRQEASAQFNQNSNNQFDEQINTENAAILVVESSELNAGKIASELVEQEHTVSVVNNSEKAMQIAKDQSFDLMIISLSLGGEDGLRLCSHFRASDDTRHVPILLVIEDENLDQLAKGLDIGVTDYLIKPVDLNELRARCKTQIKRRRYHDRLSTMLQQSVAMAYTDPLTGVFNRRYMNAHLDRSIMEIAQTAKPVSVLIFDIDHFKSVNDTYGHACGDDVLKELSGRVKGSMRDFDMLARYGGEEFVVVMPNTAEEQALSIAERVRKGVNNQDFRLASTTLAGEENLKLSVSVSVGVATTRNPMEMADELLSRADRALYSAKNQGRNRVMSA